MQTNAKLKTTSPKFSDEEMAAAMAAAEEPIETENVDWSQGVVTHGGGVEATLLELRRKRGKQKTPLKVSTTLRFDREVLDAFRATGKGWQTRINEALKEWLKTHNA